MTSDTSEVGSGPRDIGLFEGNPLNIRDLWLKGY